MATLCLERYLPGKKNKQNKEQKQTCCGCRSGRLPLRYTSHLRTVHTVRGDGKAAEQFIIFPHGFRPALDRCVAGFQQNTMSGIPQNWGKESRGDGRALVNPNKCKGRKRRE
jgi:hypothetical protein